MGPISSLAGQHQNPFGAIGGIPMAVLFPIIYGVMGSVMGALGTLTYNLIAKWFGGLQLEFQSVNSGVVPSAGPIDPF